MRNFRFIYVILLGIILIGCNSYPITGIQITANDLKSTPAKHTINVPHISQNDDYSCATTSAAMALSYYENLTTIPMDKDFAWKISGSDTGKINSIGNDMRGLKKLAAYYRYSGEYADNLSKATLEYLLSHNVLVVLNIKARDIGNTTHAVLAVGYDKNQQKIFINDPANIMTEMDYEVLEKRWAAFLSEPFGMSIKSGFVIYPKKAKISN